MITLFVLFVTLAIYGIMDSNKMAEIRRNKPNTVITIRHGKADTVIYIRK